MKKTKSQRVSFVFLPLNLKFPLCTKKNIDKSTHADKTKQGKRAKGENKKIWPERYKKKKEKKKEDKGGDRSA